MKRTGEITVNQIGMVPVLRTIQARRRLRHQNSNYTNTDLITIMMMVSKYRMLLAYLVGESNQLGRAFGNVTVE